jgi:hypothetical protein
MVLQVLFMLMMVIGIFSTISSDSEESETTTDNIDFDFGYELGSLSAKYESNGDPGSIGNNYGDFGGKSYGAYQFASNVGSVNSFLKWLMSADNDLYKRLIAAKNKDGGYGSNFDSTWKAIAKEDKEHFFDLQHAYIKYAYYDPVVEYFEARDFYINERSLALRNVVWSTAVQHGTNGAKGIIGLQDLTKSDRVIITGIYNERMKVNKYFASSSPAIRQSVYNRFIKELQDALNMLEAE